MSDIKDQYLKAHDLFDSESNRSWTRFNLFSGVQLILVAGFSSNYHELIKEKSLCIILIIAAFAFSLFTILVMWRSYQINMGAFKAILELEDIDKSLVLFKIYGKHSKSPMGTIAKCCVVMSTLLSFLWVALFIWVILK